MSRGKKKKILLMAKREEWSKEKGKRARVPSHNWEAPSLQRGIEEKPPQQRWQKNEHSKKRKKQQLRGEKKKGPSRLRPKGKNVGFRVASEKEKKKKGSPAKKGNPLQKKKTGQRRKKEKHLKEKDLHSVPEKKGAAHPEKKRKKKETKKGDWINSWIKGKHPKRKEATSSQSKKEPSSKGRKRKSIQGKARHGGKKLPGTKTGKKEGKPS